MSTIQSKIAVTKFVLTTDHEVRSRIWDLLNPYRDLIWFEGPNKTQLEFGSNPGGKPQDALAIVIANIYLAQKDSLVDIWSANRTDQLKAVNTLARELGWTIDKVTMRSWLEDAIVKFVVNATKTSIRRKVEHLRYSFNSDPVWNRWQSAVGGYQRLSAIDRNCSFLSEEVWQQRLDKVKILVDVLESEYNKLRDIVTEMVQLRDQANALKKAFDEQADNVMNLEELDVLMAAFTSTKEQLVLVESALGAFDYDETPSREASREVKMLVPAENK
jgi:hypothetical protein